MEWLSVCDLSMCLGSPQDSPPLWTIMVEWSEKERSAGDTEALYQVKCAVLEFRGYLSFMGGGGDGVKF